MENPVESLKIGIFFQIYSNIAVIFPIFAAQKNKKDI